MSSEYAIWRDVKGFPNELQVSSKGRVRAIEHRFLLDEKMTPIRVARLIEPIQMNQDYLGIHYNGRGLFIHVLVAEAFLPNPGNKRLIIHNDGNKKHNDATNLKYQTNSECAKEAIASGIMKKPPGYKGKIIECIDTGEFYFGLRATAIRLNVTQSQLERAAYGGELLNGHRYKIWHNYSILSKLRPELFKEI